MLKQTPQLKSKNGLTKKCKPLFSFYGKNSATKSQRHKKSMKYKLLSKKVELIAKKIPDAASIE